MSVFASEQTPSLSIIIPAKNEAENIRPLIAEIQAAMANRDDYELLYVDDGSTDETWQELLSVQQQSDCPLTLLRHQQSVGQSLAILSAAWQASGEWLVVLDADGQNDPADIPGMVDAVIAAHRKDPQVWGIIGHRVKRRSSKVANGFRDLLLNDGIPDTGCGLKAVLRERYLRMPAFNHMHRYIPTLLQSQGGIMLVH